MLLQFILPRQSMTLYFKGFWFRKPMLHFGRRNTVLNILIYEALHYHKKPNHILLAKFSEILFFFSFHIYNSCYSSGKFYQVKRIDCKYLSKIVILSSVNTCNFHCAISTFMILDDC